MGVLEGVKGVSEVGMWQPLGEHGSLRGSIGGKMGVLEGLFECLEGMRKC